MSGDPGDSPATDEELGEAETLSEVDAELAVATRTSAQRSSAAADSAGASRIARFAIRAKLGEGGMGTVFLAYDPAADRQVALKVLHADAWAGDSASRGRERLVREARAMARLSHPNVVIVHEVGEVDGEVFLAMEYAEGGTLTRWLAERERSWQEIVTIFTAAGRGLAAAHAAGLVHRDFKPDNVVMTAEGVVRVADFGIVGVDAWRHSDNPDSLLSTRLTMTGSVCGTPVYMAPEQHQRGPVGPAADQFAFCVALYEALFATRPFAGSTYGELKANVCAGRLVDAPADSEVPEWLGAVVGRGLATDPHRRHASMEDLIAALARDPGGARRRRLRGATIGAVLLAMAVIAVLGWRPWRGRGVKLCAGGQAVVAEVWNDAARAAVERALLSTGKSYAADTNSRVRAGLDDYAAALATMRDQACAATHVGATQSDVVLDRRMRCLDRRRDELAATVEVLAEKADVGVLDHAVQAVSNLTPVARCGQSLLAGAPPVPVAMREQVRELRGQLAAVEARVEAGDYQRGRELAATALSDARAIGYPPTLAQALFQSGVVARLLGDLAGAERDLRETFKVAAAAKDDAMVGRAGARLMLLVGSDKGRADEALAMLSFTELAISRSGEDSIVAARALDDIAMLLRRVARHEEALSYSRRGLAIAEAELGPNHLTSVRMRVHQAGIFYRRGAYEKAVAMLEEALSGLEQALGADHPEVATALANLGAIHYSLGEYARALPYQQRSLAIRERVHGPDHVDVAASLTTLGAIYSERGEHALAQPLFERALAIHEKRSGGDHPSVAEALNNLGRVLLNQNQLGPARDYFERALAMWTRVSPDHPDLAWALSNLGNVAQLAGKHREAVDFYNRALAVRERGLGADHPEVALTLMDLGNALDDLGQPRQALARCQRAHAINEKSLGLDSPGLAFDLTCIGSARTKLGQPRRAAADLERALELHALGSPADLDIATTEFALAEALARTGARERALALATEARRVFGERGLDRHVADVDAWLRGQRDR